MESVEVNKSELITHDNLLFCSAKCYEKWLNKELKKYRPKRVKRRRENILITIIGLSLVILIFLLMYF